VLREADAYAIAQGLDLPLEPKAHIIGPMPEAALHPIRTLDLAGISTVIWATGYALDFGWIEMDIFNAKGAPKHVDGQTEIDGLYFVGLPFLSHRGSAFIWGAWRDGGAVARLIAQP
jgi:putative flavoprotein involved in K+ transport